MAVVVRSVAGSGRVAAAGLIAGVGMVSGVGIVSGFSSPAAAAPAATTVTCPAGCDLAQDFALVTAATRGSVLRRWVTAALMVAAVVMRARWSWRAALSSRLARQEGPGSVVAAAVAVATAVLAGVVEREAARPSAGAR